ncbi:MAG: glycosyltransferase family 4 protein [Deltaproteobacteria bacterium]|nr:glycosyltransferase family 4 protein [Deltaproteobacteria bacterium]
MTTREPIRPARVLALSEAPIPSAVLGVHAVFDALASGTRRCELRTGSTVTPSKHDFAWADSVVLVRGASPGERRILVEAKRLGKRVATYVDDDLERVPAEARSGYFFTSEEVRRNVAFIVAHADDVLVCSDRLADEIVQRHRRRPLRVLQPRPPRLPGETVPRPAASPTRIGFLGSVDHAAFLDALLGDVLREVHAELGGRVEFVFCGAEPKVALDLEAERHPFEIDFGGWRRRALGLGIAIGLAPLPESDFHRFKYWNKYLEYGSLGIAGIYSDVPPSQDVVRDGATGLLCANDPAAWKEAIQRLVSEPALRDRIGHAAYLDVEARFSVGALLPHWTTALGPILDHRAPPCRPEDVQLVSGPLRHALDRLAIYGPLRFTERVLGRLTGRFRWG